jgi:hypothetical protein
VIRSATMASDLVIIQAQPSEAVIVRPKLKAAFAVSRKIVNTALA